MSLHRHRAVRAILLGITAALLVSPLRGQPAKKPDVLRIGSGGDLSLDAATGKEAEAKEAAALDSLKNFIRTETGFANEIVRLKTWREVSDQLAAAKLELGVFQGYEYAWAKAKQPELRPLALAVNGHTYRTACMLARQDSKATDFAGLAGQTVALPRAGHAHLRLYVERQCQILGKELAAFFTKVTAPDNFEDALDDVVDGMVQAAVVDRVGMEAYQRRKPGRFAKLKEVVRSPAFPPPLVAYRDGALDAATLQRLRDGLINASKKKEGERLLTLFRLTGFENVPGDFDKVVSETLKGYPLQADGAK